MISFARTLRTAVAFAILASAGIAARAVASEEPVLPDSSVIEGVRARIAEAWEVEAAELVLEWGRVPSLVASRPGAVRDLVGRGADGWYAAVIEPRDGRAVSVRVRAGIRDSVWVAARRLEPGAALTRDDLVLEERLAWGAPAPRSDCALGWELRRGVAAGERIVSSILTPPVLIRAGEPVRLEWNRGGVFLALTGTAVNSAREGDAVRARIPGREDPVTGIATAPGLAQLAQGGTR